MAAQSCGHKPWDAVHLEAFMGYWGHAARLEPHLNRPIKIAMQVRDETWMLANPQIRRMIGRWPNAAYGLSLLWRRCRLPSDPPSWELMAQNRLRWKDFTQEVFQIKRLLMDKFILTSMKSTCAIDACSGQASDSGFCHKRIRPWTNPTLHPFSQVIEGPEIHDNLCCM